ncbi:MAG: putative ABC transporter permease subunit [Thermodesulfovibrionales bacterium]
MLLTLLQPKVLSLKNTLTARVVLRRAPFIAAGIGFWILLYLGTSRALSFIREIAFLGEMLSAKLLSMIFFSLTGFLILSNVITALSSFYLSKDLPFLLTKPVEVRDVLRLKALETCLNSSWMVLSFVPPLFLAYGISYHAPAVYYLAVSLAFLLLVLLTAAVGICIAHILTRFFPARRIRLVFLGAGMLLFLIFYFMTKSVIPRTAGAPEDLFRSFISFRTDAPFLPGYWITETLLPLLRGKTPDVFYLLLLLSNAAFFSLLSFSAGKRFFRRNLERLQPAGPGPGRGISGRVYPDRETAVLYKDIMVFFRDTGQWSQLSIIGLLVLVYIYNFKTIPMDAMAGLTPLIKELLLLINMLLAGLVLSAVAARFLYTAVSLEGEAFWIIRTAPVNISRFLWSKFLYGCTALTALILLVVFLTNRALGVSGPLMYLSIGTTVLLCISVCGLGTGLGALYPKFRYENIAAVSMSLGGMVFMLLAFLLVTATLSLEAWAYYSWHAGPQTAGVRIGLCILLIVAINAAALLLPMKIGAKRLAELSP